MLANYLLNQKSISALPNFGFDYIRTDFSLDADWNRLCTGTIVESTDQLKRLQTTAFSEKDNSPEWALMLRVRDSMLRRRNWMIQIGICMTDSTHAGLFCSVIL